MTQVTAATYFLGMNRRLVPVALLLAALAGLTSCAGEDGPDGGGADSSGTSDATAGAAEEEDDLVEARCRSRQPQDVPYEVVRVTDGTVDVDGVLLLPEDPAPVAVAMLPQVNAGLCGGLHLATRLAEQGVSVLAIDACGYDESTCAEGVTPREQVDAVAAVLTERVGDVPVVAVGASMGGSLVAQAVAGGAGVERWVDLSGPVEWEGVNVLDDPGALAEVTGMVAHAPGDVPIAFRQSQRLAREVGAEFVRGPGANHGWDMVTGLDGKLTRIGRRVADFVLAAGS